MASWVGVPGGVAEGVAGNGVGAGVYVCAECDEVDVGEIVDVVSGVVTMADALV